LRWPTGTDVTAIRSRERTYSKFYLGVQRGKERTSGCGVHGGAGIIYVGCAYQLGNLDLYDAAEHCLTFGTVGILVGTDIRPRMTLAVGTLDDPFLYGSARVRMVDAAADRIYLEPNNLSAEGYLIAGDYIWVDGVYRLYRILPRIVNGVVYEDGNPDSLNPGWGFGYGVGFDVRYLDRPVALMGSPRFAWTGEAINFYGWRSHGRGGRTINAYAWGFDGGVAGGAGAAAAGTPAAPVTATWNAAGEYIASLTVTDSSGNPANDAYGVPFEDHVAVRPVLVYDRPGEGDNPPYTRFEVKNLRGNYGSGWTASFEVFGTADKSEFPDNALVIVFAEDWYGGAKGSRGGWYGQEGILFCGYIQADTVRVDSEKSSVSFEARTIEQWMKDIDVWPLNCVSDATAKWHHWQNMVVEDVLWFLAEMRSTLKNVTDCFFCSDPDGAKLLGFLDLTEASLYDQMSDQIGSCFFGQLSASRHGSVHLFRHKNMLDLAERTLWGPPIWVFSKQDWRDELEIGDERMRDSVAQVDFIGFIYDTDGNPQEVYSLSPANQTNFGLIEKVTGILLSGNTRGAATIAQIEANTLSGLYRAWKNTRFPHIRVPAFNNRFLEPATLDYFGITLVAGDTVRGYEWPGKEFLTTEVSYEIDAEKGVILADVTGEASTWGPEGVAGDYPQYEPNLSDENPPEYAAIWPSDPPPWAAGDDTPVEGSDAWEPAAGDWNNDGGPGNVWKFFIYDDRLFALCETGDVDRGLWERTGPATWVHRGLGMGEYDAWTWLGRVWIISVADNSIYRTTAPENAASWILDFTPPGTEIFNIKGCAATYGGWLYVATVDTTASPDVVHFHRRGGSWTLDYLPQYTNPISESMDAYDFVKYGRYWWSGYEQGTGYIFKYSNGGAFLDNTTNLQAGKFEYCHAMYFTSTILNKIYRSTGGGWVEDYDFDGDSINYVDLSIDWTEEVAWVGAEIDAANIQCHAKWWGEDWRSILPSCADTWGGGAIRGPDDHVYLGGSGNIWRFVPA
jgi:hypothetical protein